MRGNFRLRKFLAGGSSLTEAHFADGGALEEVDYPRYYIVCRAEEPR